MIGAQLSAGAAIKGVTICALFNLIAIIIVCTVVVYPQTRSHVVQGEVKDQHGDLLVGAKVSLTNEQNSTREAISDTRGAFRFSDLAEGRYELVIIFAGFSEHTETLMLRSDTSLAPLLINLYPTIKASVTVFDSQNGVGLDPQMAAGAKVLTEKELRTFADDPDELLQQLQELATSSGSAPGQATVTVDGFLTDGRIVPKSAIREVRINPDLFSAEFDKAPYQGGRIEIYTKPGAEKFHGAGFYNFNNTVLNARQAFAPTRAPSSSQLYGLQLGGPLVRKSMGFFLDYESRRINELATVDTVIADKNFQPVSFAASVPTPKRLTLGSARVDWQVSPATTFIARFDFNENKRENLGVGGFNLSDRAFDARTTEKSLRFTATTILSKSMLNEARLGLTLQQNRQQAASDGRITAVLGSFTQGGATVQSLDHREYRLEFADTLSMVAGNHSLRFGTQIFGKRVIDRRADNTQGTFIFGGGSAPQLDENGRIITGSDGPVIVNITSFEQYRRTLLGLPGGSPTRFSITIGDPQVRISQWLYAGFAQDEWRLLPNLTVSFGLRVEGQTSPTGQLSFAPRLGIAYSPDKKQRTVFRARAGIFYDRITESLELEARRLDGFRQQQLIADQPFFPDPFQNRVLLSAIPLKWILDPRLHPPVTFQVQLGFERQLAKGWKVETSYYWTQGWSLLRSRNINAPLIETTAVGTVNPDPLVATRPFGASGNIMQFESSGKIRGQVLYLGVNQSGNKYFRLYAGYLLFDFHTDTDSAFLQPQSSYNLSGEDSRPSWQARHRAFMGGTINLPWKLHASPSLNIASGTPFNITTGRDNNGDGSFTDRPSLVDPSAPGAILTRFGAFDPTVVNGSLPRNAGTNRATATLDLGLSRTFGFGVNGASNDKPYQLTFNAHVSNLLNHVNVLGYSGVVTSPFFGRANNAAPARQITIGLRFSF
ncbi:MAG TPA: TonB-dependent receptor [Pyrinomonadaceae bacterium]|nr:TonB-dependent receptor [Pyrinomonadaceae bacterium]